MEAKRLFITFNILVLFGLTSSFSLLGCEPPEEMMAEDWASDAETSDDEWVDMDEETSSYVGATKADSALSRAKTSEGNSKAIRVLRDSQRPLIGTEAIGHGTPQPWKPSDGTPEASEDDQ